MADEGDDRQHTAHATSSPGPPGPGNQGAPASEAPIAAKDLSPAEQAQINQDAAIASGEENVV